MSIAYMHLRPSVALNLPRSRASAWQNLEPAASAVKATATKKNNDDEDDQKRGGIHRSLLAEPKPNRPEDPAIDC